VEHGRAEHGRAEPGVRGVEALDKAHWIEERGRVQVISVGA
jgi:hypothetical protein